MSARLISNSPEFYRAVEVLREFDPPIMGGAGASIAQLRTTTCAHRKL
jgi:hypothetical protein